MKTFILAVLFGLSVSVVSGAVEIAAPSPAQLRIDAAQRVLQKQPNRCQAYNDLAQALLRRARETGDKAWARSL